MVVKSPTTLDLLVIYPDDFTGAEEAAMLTFVDTSVSLANDVFVNSNVPAQYQLMAKVKLSGPQPPASGLFDVLEWMDTDPQELLDLRQEYAADVVAMFVPLSYDVDDACGAANLPHGDGQIRPLEPGGQSPGPFDTRAFRVSWRPRKRWASRSSTNGRT